VIEGVRLSLSNPPKADIVVDFDDVGPRPTTTKQGWLAKRVFGDESRFVEVETIRLLIRWHQMNSVAAHLQKIVIRPDSRLFGTLFVHLVVSMYVRSLYTHHTLVSQQDVEMFDCYSSH
jgi:hypothetical protein